MPALPLALSGFVIALIATAVLLVVTILALLWISGRVGRRRRRARGARRRQIAEHTELEESAIRGREAP